MLSTIRTRRFALLWLCLVIGSSPWLVQRVRAVPRCFQETNLCIDGRFRQFWEQQGGLPVFGLPITAEGQDGQFRAQSFERNRFELHPENAAPYDVLLGRLGDDRLQQQGRDWRAFPQASPNAAHFFVQTGHAIAYEPFWRFWSSQGLDLGDPGVSERESLALFGYPLSEPMMETNASGDTVLTQWFERARFEYHGAQGVLLGLLGSETRNEANDAAAAQDPVRLAWFYKPPSNDVSAATLAKRVDDFILTHPDEQFRDQLISNGVPSERILQYIMANQIQQPSSCSEQPWGNQFAFKPGDFCRIANENPDWFLLDQNGKRICKLNITERFCMMDPGNAGWRAFAVERVRELRDRWGWQGVFLDNVDGSRVRADNNTRQYADDAAYQQAVEGYLAYLQDNYFRREQLPLFANITETRNNDEVWYRYLRLLDGAMDEGCIVGWRADYREPSEWAAHLDRLEKTQALGKTVFCVAQGDTDDADHLQFAFASYLLITNGRVTFRYTNNRKYSEFRHYSLYDRDLGAPLGPRYRDGQGWRRDFERGSVFVDPTAQKASITTR